MHNSILFFAIRDLEGFLLVSSGSEAGEKGGGPSTLSEFRLRGIATSDCSDCSDCSDWSDFWCM